MFSVPLKKRTCRKINCTDQWRGWEVFLDVEVVILSELSAESGFFTSSTFHSAELHTNRDLYVSITKKHCPDGISILPCLRLHTGIARGKAPWDQAISLIPLTCDKPVMGMSNLYLTDLPPSHAWIGTHASPSQKILGSFGIPLNRTPEALSDELSSVK